VDRLLKLLLMVSQVMKTYPADESGKRSALSLLLHSTREVTPESSPVQRRRQTVLVMCA